MNNFSTAEKVRAHADVMELHGIEFLNADGKYARDYRKCVEVRLTFIDATVFRLKPSEFDKFDDYEFQLRPVRDDA